LAGEFGILAAHLLDEPLCVVAVDDDATELARVVRRAQVEIA